MPTDLAGRGRRSVVALAAALVLAALLPGGAFAHATFVASEPADGASVTTSPDEIRVTFSEAISIPLSTVRLVDANGALEAVGRLSLDPANQATLIIATPGLRPGVHRLEWRVVDSSDLHASIGSSVFGVGEPATGTGSAAAAETDLGDAAATFLDRLAQAVLVGSLALYALLLRIRRGPQDAVGVPRRSVAFLARAAGLLAIVTGFGSLLIRTLGAAGDRSLGSTVLTALGTSHGTAWIVHEVAIVGLAVVAARCAQAEWIPAPPGSAPEPRPAGPRLALATIVLVGVAGGSAAWSGHAAVGPANELAVRTAALALHDVAAAVWVGGLIALAAAVGPSLRSGSVRSVRPVLAAFAWLAVPAVAGLAISGVYLSGQLVATVDALVSTPYGRLLVAKTVVVALLLAAGAWNATRIHGRRPASPGRRVLRGEAVAGIAVVLLAGTLSATPPARGPGVDPAPIASTELAEPADDLILTAVVRPNRPGPNFISVGVFDTRRPTPAPISRVVIHIVSPTGVESGPIAAALAGPGRYEASTGGLTVSGAWRLRLEVERPGRGTARLDRPWVVATAGAAPGTSPSSTRLGDLATPSALGLAVIATLLIAFALARRRRRPDQLRRASAADRPPRSSRIIGLTGEGTT